MMTSNDILNEYLKSENHKDLSTFLQIDALKLYIEKVSGSLISFYIASQVLDNKGSHMVIMQDKERAAYIFNDLQHLCGEKVNSILFR